MPKYQPQHEEKDGGFYFADYDIHVVAGTLKDAKSLVKKYHGVDVDVDPNAEPVEPTTDDEKSSEQTDE